MKTISIRLNDNDYDALTRLVDEMGISKQDFYAVYTKTALRERQIPFIIKAPQDPFYSEQNISELERRVADLKSGKSTLKEHDLIEAD